MFAFSAPRESPPPPQRNTHVIASDVRREVVSEVQTLVSDIRGALKSQEGADGRHLSVSIAHAPSATEYTLTVA
jgi:GH18 family chitinase